MELSMNGKHILDCTCGSRSIWFDKDNESTIYTDRRKVEYSDTWKSGEGLSTRTMTVDPDILCDFTDLPFDDASFELVVFDPPHSDRISRDSWTGKYYERLDDGWQDEIRRGFNECMRVLKPYGTLIFKWSDVHISTREVINAIGVQPLFGHRSGKKMNTHRMTFMKGVSCGDA